MISVKKQLERAVKKLVKEKFNASYYIKHETFNSGYITYPSYGCNYNDNKVYYTWDNSTNDFDVYKLKLQLDWNNHFRCITDTILKRVIKMLNIKLMKKELHNSFLLCKILQARQLKRINERKGA